jgi:uncharacterized protein
MAKTKAIFHVDLRDKAILRLAFANIRNLLTELGENEVSAELVANGEAVKFFVSEYNDLEDPINELASKGVRMLACEKAMKKYEVDKSDLLSCVSTIPAGVVQLVKRQEEGWSYVKA